MAELAKAGLKMGYKKTYRVVGDGNFAFTHSEGEFAGRHIAFADLFHRFPAGEFCKAGSLPDLAGRTSTIAWTLLTSPLSAQLATFAHA